MRLRWTVLLVALGALGALDAVAQRREKPPQTQTPAFQFREHSIGESIDEKYPYWQKGYRGRNIPSCSKKDVDGHVACEDAKTIPSESQYSHRLVGGVLITQLEYHFLDGKLSWLEMHFKTAAYPEIAGMLEGRYGPPTVQKVEKVQNRAGASFSNIVKEWKFREGTLRAQSIFGRVDTAFVEFENPAAIREYMARKRAADGAKGQRAF